MSTEKEKLEQLIGRIDELVGVLTKISEDLRTTSASIKSIAISQITQPASQPSTAAPRPTPKKTSLDDVRMAFPEDLDNLISFEEKGEYIIIKPKQFLGSENFAKIASAVRGMGGEYIIIKPKQFLGSENFAKIASAVRGMGGEYISAGKDSHFRISKKRNS